MTGARTRRGPARAPLATPEPQVGAAVRDQAAGLRALASITDHAAQARVAPATARAGSPVVAVGSGKGGVGKTTVAVNLAIAMRKRRRAILVDADHGTANADVLCGLAPSRRLDLVLVGGREPDLSSVLIETPYGFGLVPGAAGVASTAAMERGQRERLIGAFRGLGEPGGVVLVDLSAGIGQAVVESFAASDLGVVVTTPEPTALADAYALIKCVVRHRGDERPLRMGLVVNQSPSRAIGRAAHDRIDRVCRRFLGGSMPLLGIVRRDRRAGLAVRNRTPLMAGWPGCGMARDLRGLGVMVSAVTPRVGRPDVAGVRA